MNDLKFIFENKVTAKISKPTNKSASKGLRTHDCCQNYKGLRIHDYCQIYKGEYYNRHYLNILTLNVAVSTIIHTTLIF